MKFKVYFKILGGHVHARLFVNGAKSGDLVFRIDEWPEFRKNFTGRGRVGNVEYVNEDEQDLADEEAAIQDAVGFLSRE